jgi:thiol:disulfide interchange protein
MSKILKEGTWALLIPAAIWIAYIFLKETTSTILTTIFLIGLYPASKIIITNSISQTSTPFILVGSILINLAWWFVLGSIVTSIYDAVRKKPLIELEQVTNSNALIKKY